MKAKYNYKVGQIYKFNLGGQTAVYILTEIGENFLAARSILSKHQKGSFRFEGSFRFDIASFRERKQTYLGDNEQVVKVLYL